MKRKLKTAAFLTAAILCVSLLSGCSQEKKNTDINTDTDAVSEEVSETESKNPTKSSKEQSQSSEQPSEEEIPTSDTESSVTASEESPDVISETPPESSEKSEKPEKSQTESSTIPESSAESSEEGYTSDDEQIENSHEHTEEDSKIYTDNSDFNELFAANSIDAAYTEEMKNSSGTTSDMRSITQKYTNQWETTLENAYTKLYELLEDNPEEQENLDSVQTQWREETEKTVEDIYQQANTDQTGTLGLMNADSKVYDLYKNRAAVLYEQIYSVTGNFELY